MENASKALLIAASVLIAIVLIAVGIKILSSTSGVTDQVDTVSDTMAISVFNSQFSTYFTTSTTGTYAKNFVTKIMANNSASNSHTILLNLYPKSGSKIVHKKKVTDLQSIYDAIKNEKKYSIEMTTNCDTYPGGYNNGYIACISIREK